MRDQSDSKEKERNALYLDTVHVILTLNRYLRRYAKKLQAEELSGRQISTLRHLLEKGPSTMGELSSYLFINESSTSEHVAKLEKSKLVRRDRSKSDNRVVEVTITPKGQALANEAPLGGVPLLREKLKELSIPQLKQLKSAVTLLVDLLEIQNDGS